MIFDDSLPKTNSELAPENQFWLEDDPFLQGFGTFSGAWASAVSFRERILSDNKKPGGHDDKRKLFSTIPASGLSI